MWEIAVSVFLVPLPHWVWSVATMITDKMRGGQGWPGVFKWTVLWGLRLLSIILVMVLIAASQRIARDGGASSELNTLLEGLFIGMYSVTWGLGALFIIFLGWQIIRTFKEEMGKLETQIRR